MQNFGVGDAKTTAIFNLKFNHTTSCNMLKRFMLHIQCFSFAPDNTNLRAIIGIKRFRVLIKGERKYSLHGFNEQRQNIFHEIAFIFNFIGIQGVPLGTTIVI